jgi:hypothetical protein
VQLRCGCFSFGDCKSPSAKVKMVVSRRGCLDHKNKVSAKVGSETRLHRNVIKIDLIRRRVASIQEVMIRWSNRTCSLWLYLPYPRGNGRSSVRNGSWLAAHGSQFKHGRRSMEQGKHSGRAKASSPSPSANQTNHLRQFLTSQRHCSVDHRSAQLGVLKAGLELCSNLKKSLGCSETSS